MKTKGVPQIIVSWAVSLGVYSSGLKVAYYGDDMRHIFDRPAAMVFHDYCHENTFGYYRPVESSVLAIVQAVFGLNTVPIHLMQVLIHGSLGWLVFVFMKRLGFSTLRAALASLFLLISQANVLAVASNDTLSQVGGTFLGYFSLWLLYCSYVQRSSFDHYVPSHPNRKLHTLSLIAFLLALFSKESSVSFLPMLMSVVFFLSLTTETIRLRVVEMASAVWPYLAVFLLYLVMRAFAINGQSIYSSGGLLHIGANVPRNLALSFFGLSIPASTVSIFQAFKNREIGMVVLCIAATLAVWCAVVYAIISSRQRRTIVVSALFSVVALLPMVAMTHISELYLYNSLPCFAVLVGCGLGAIVENARDNGAKMSLTILIVMLFFTSHFVAVRRKTVMMRQNGERAGELLRQIVAKSGEVPSKGELVLVNPRNDRVEYSVFVCNGFNVLEFGLSSRMKQLTGRDDISARIVESTFLGESPPSTGRLILTLSGDEIRVIDAENH